MAGQNVHATAEKLVHKLELALVRVPKLALNIVHATEIRLWNTSPALAPTNHDAAGAPPMTTVLELPMVFGTIMDSATFTDTEPSKFHIYCIKFINNRNY